MKALTEITGIILVALGIVVVISGIVIAVGFGYLLVGISMSTRTINTYSIIAGGKVMIQGFLIMGAGEMILLVKDYCKRHLEFAEPEEEALG